LLRLLQVTRRFEINVQPQLVLLQKTLLSIEGLTRQLAPELDLWSSAAPQIEKWLKKQVGFKAFLQRIKNNLPLWSEQLPEIPTLLHEVLKEKKHQQEKTRFTQTTNFPENNQRERKLKIEYFLGGVGLTVLVFLLIDYLR
ncbi:MAG: ubiquinone biosynthesis regulatory protein kinase UbiB, partial [Gammaproteobacteria bacterium]|nr:ubiquinone biosynthesis regulatory protein kinase UbiB [Gammaproteobacteria bacterium]